MKINKGFTLLEVLLTITLTSIVIAVAGGLLTFTIRTEEKTRTILELKQNGDNLIFKMNQKIRDVFEVQNASSICSTNPSAINQISFRDKNGNTLDYRCYNNTIKENNNNLLAFGGNYFIPDYNTCFKCYSDEFGKPQIIEISFTLRQLNSNPLKQYQLNFFTSIFLRLALN